MRSGQSGWTLLGKGIQDDVCNYDDEDFWQDRIPCLESIVKVPLEGEDLMLGLGRCLVAFQFQWCLSLAERIQSSVVVQNQDAYCIAGRSQE